MKTLAEHKDRSFWYRLFLDLGYRLDTAFCDGGEKWGHQRLSLIVVSPGASQQHTFSF